MTEQGKTKVDQLREVLKAKKEAEERAKAQSPESPQLTATCDEAAPDDLSSQIRAAEEEAKAHYDKLLRVMAEFENFKKRNEKDRIEAIRFANERLIEELLPVLDHLDEALANVNVASNGGEAVRSLLEGVELTGRQFLAVLAKHGLEPIEPEAGVVFDPSIHEAITTVEEQGVAAGAVVARFRRGYKLHGRILRAAMVSVAK